MSGATHRIVALAMLIAFVVPTNAVAVTESLPAPDPVQRTWMRTDQPVERGVSERTWMWGPIEDGFQTLEPYAESPNGERIVTYFDKSRMEVTYPDADRSSDWYVTNGLLVVELMTGRLQRGDDSFEERGPADLNVAGDPDDPTGPTYATFSALRDLPARANGEIIATRVDRDGTLVHDATLAGYAAFAAERLTAPGIDHRVASPFWEFMQSSGTVFEDWRYSEGEMFPNPIYATGLPITEAYWSRVKVADVYRDVLMQCFERRCLTWDPANPEGWQVEAGNVGLHYYTWRYGLNRPEPTHLEVTFNLYHDEELIASTVTSETFYGSLAVGSWETRDPAGTLLSVGSLWAEHSLTGIDAVIVQDGPNPGWGKLSFQLGFSLSGLVGDGEFNYAIRREAGDDSGTIRFTARASSLTEFDVALPEVPPVLFTGP